MAEVNNSIVFKRTIEALYAVVGRRTLDSFAVQILKSSVKNLEKKFDFLHYVDISDDFYMNEGIHATIDARFNNIDLSQLGDAIDTLIRVIYLELIQTVGDDVGLYFISEIKEHLSDIYVDELRRYGVRLDSIQAEQHIRYQMKGLQHDSSTQNKEGDGEEPEYSWEEVSTWKYDNNVCRLYDEKGTLLDTLQLDLLIEEYIKRVSEEKKQQRIPSPRTTMLRISEKENELLQLMRRRDSDVQTAVVLLHISRQKFDAMIQKLLHLEMLQYISENEVKLTEKGLQYLSEQPK
jgi:hypothetical protein